MSSENFGNIEEYPARKENGKEERKLKKFRKTEKTRRGSVDLPFLILTITLLAIGVIMVLSASYARAYYTHGDPTKYFVRQGIFALTGIGLMLLMSKVRMTDVRRFSMIALIGSIGLLLLVPIIGVEDNGAQRWLSLGFTTFQPSELTKLAVIISFASMICIYKDKMRTFRYGIVPFAIILIVIIGLLLLEPHISASIIIICVSAIMLFVGGVPLKWFVCAGIAVGLGGLLLITQMDYAMARIEVWRDPFSDMQGKGFQIVQSLYAIGSGGLFGLGLGQGRQKYLYLPEEHNDFIFSVVCEELGFVGASLILLLFALLIIRGFWLSLHSKDRYSALVGTGVTSLLAIQVFFNIAVVTNLLPCTGISLPFFSYGGTALWLQMIEMGIILSISRDIPLSKKSD